MHRGEAHQCCAIINYNTFRMDQFREWNFIRSTRRDDDDTGVLYVVYMFRCTCEPWPAVGISRFPSCQRTRQWELAQTNIKHLLGHFQIMWVSLNWTVDSTPRHGKQLYILIRYLELNRCRTQGYSRTLEL